MDEQLAKHLGKQLAKAAISRIAGNKDLRHGWQSVPERLQAEVLEDIAEGMASALKAGTLQERDDLIKVVAAASGTWSDLAHRVMQMWGDDIGDSVVPTWGPLAVDVEDCVCKGDPDADCVWCENCGKLTPAVKRLIQQAAGGESHATLCGEEGEADPAQTVLNMLLRTRERGVRCVEIGNDEIGSVKVEFFESSNERKWGEHAKCPRCGSQLQSFKDGELTRWRCSAVGCGAVVTYSAMDEGGGGQ